MNKWVGYVSISVIMIFGILFATGMAGQYPISTRILVTSLIFAYILIRILFLLLRGRRKVDGDANQETSTCGRGADQKVK